MTSLSLPRAVVFDGDGVLFDSEKLTNRAFTQVLASHGVEMTLEDTAPFIGFDSTHLVKEVEGLYGIKLEVGEYERQRDMAYEKLCREENGPERIPGIGDLLEWLEEQEIAVALATGASPKKMIFNLNRTGLLERFPHRVTREDVEHGKPAPDIYVEAARQIGFEGSGCFVVEDSIPGLQGAKAAGAIPIAITGSHPEQELREHAEAVFQDHFELLAFLKELK